MFFILNIIGAPRKTYSLKVKCPWCQGKYLSQDALVGVNNSFRFTRSTTSVYN